MNTSKLAIVYVRVSTEHQVDNYSVQDQRGLESLAKRHGFKRVEVREEQGVSAETITARPVMKGILEDIIEGIVGAIIVSSFTRLTRDMDDIDGKIIKKTCRDHDSVIITPEKLYDFSNEADDDLADLQFFFSKIQKRMNLKPMIRGEYTKAKNGGFVGLPLSVGYDYVWKMEETPRNGMRSVADLVINEDEAKVVRYIHEIFPNYLYRQVAVHLNKLVGQGKMMQFPIKYKYLREKYGATHRAWRDADIRFIINNDLYVGRMQYAVNAKSPFLRGLEPIYTHRQDLRILSDKVFEMNQNIAAMRKRIPTRSKGCPHLFSGVLHCPFCGSVMSGKRQMRFLKSKKVPRYSYECAEYQRSGPTVCAGYWLPEREVMNIVVQVLTELIQENLRGHFARMSESNPVNESLEGEIKAEIAKINSGIKNLLEAVKQGALSIEAIKEENVELQEAKRRLEQRLHRLKNSTQLENELRGLLKIFDHNLDDVLAGLTENRLRFNALVRIFFSALVVEIDRAGMGWRKGKLKGELPICNPRIMKFALNSEFKAYIEENTIELPASLRQAEIYVENRSESQGSPRI